LGLSVVYGFVTQSQGAIGIESVPGAGTTVTLYLPRALEPQATEAGTPPADAGAATGRAGAGATLREGLRVLLVEDDAEVRQIAAGYLHGLGCAVQTAASGEEAWTLLEGDGTFDALLTDIALGTGMR